MSMALNYNNTDPIGYGNVIFHHIPNGLAPSFQACLIVYAICCGVMGLEIMSNLDYDYALARRSGWLTWSKSPSRVAYFISRYFSFVFLINVLLFSTVGGYNCAVFAQVNQIMWMIPLLCVDFIFIQRTMALYGWSPKICAVLYLYFAADIAFAIAAVGFFGRGYTIPGSNFCAFYTTNDSKVHTLLFIAYNIVLNSMDCLILLLTCHRLVEGGLLGIPRSIKERCEVLFGKEKINRNSTSGILSPRETISSLLIRQGLHYYFILLITRLAYLLVYYTSTDGESVYQVLCTAILATAGPLLANRLFRETSEFVRARTTIRSNHNHSDDRITSSRNHNLPLTNNSSSYKMQPMRSNAKTSSYGDDDDDDDDFTFPGQKGGSGRSNTQGLKIYVNERLSSFIDDYDDRAPPGLPRLPQRHLSYADPPPQQPAFTSPVSQRPFVNTIAVDSGSPASTSASPESPLPIPPRNASFDIRCKRPNSSQQQWI